MPTNPSPGYMSVLPKGLLSFLDIKNDAAYPQKLLLDLAPVMDLAQWYLETNSELTSGNTGNLVQGPNLTTPTSLAVPEKEWWYVSNLTGTCTTAAGGAVIMAVGAQFFGTGTTTFIVGDYVTGAASTEVRTQISRPFFAGPGSNFAILVGSITGVFAGQIAIRFSRLRV